MKSILVAVLVLGLTVSLVRAMDFGLAENSLSEFKAIKYENDVHQGTHDREVGVNQDD